VDDEQSECGDDHRGVDVAIGTRRDRAHRGGREHEGERGVGQPDAAGRGDHADHHERVRRIPGRGDDRDQRGEGADEDAQPDDERGGPRIAQHRQRP
jgi:hypothetical protein